MKSFITALALTFGLLASSSSGAQVNDRVYLGGALNLQHCAQVAGSFGYAYGVFGPGFDSRGLYYPYWNACFGSGHQRPIERNEEFYFYPYLRDGYEFARCINELERTNGIWRCDGWHRSTTIIECSPSRLMTYSEASNVRRDLERLFCVDFVDGPRARR